MENITHSLVGLAVAETTLQSRRSNLRGPLYAASLAANNFPDLDFLYTRFLSKPLGYILHHRGYTHTLLLVIPQGLLILLALFLYSRWRKQAWSARDWGAIAILSFLGIGLHILLDSLNSYGVHPFWPFSNNWYYLDSVFILEPMFWLALAPPLALAASTRKASAIFWGFAAGALGLLFYAPFVPLLMKFLYSAFAVFFIASAFYFNPLQRSLISLCYAAIFASGLIIISQGVDGSVRARMEHLNPEDTIQDVVRTPYPGNPFCWSVIVLGSNAQAGTYWARTGRYRLPFTPKSTKFCRSYAAEFSSPTLKAIPPDPESEAIGITWFQSFERPLSEFQNLSRNSCQFGAFLQFARIPFWIDSKAGLSYGDLRYARGITKGFSEFSSTSNAECPKQVPAWKQPTHELLGLSD